MMTLGSIFSVAISPDGSLMASGSQDRSIKIYRTKELQTAYHLEKFHEGNKAVLVTNLMLDLDTISSLLFTPDARFLISGSYDATIKVLNLRTLYPETINTGHEGTESLFFSLQRINCAFSDGITCLALIDQGKTVVSSSFDCTVRFFDLRSGIVKRVLRNIHSGNTSGMISNCTLNDIVRLDFFDFSQQKFAGNRFCRSIYCYLFSHN